MKITLIDGSPKTIESASHELLKALAAEFSDAEINWLKVISTTNEADSLLLESDVIVFSFPLYVDSLPSHLIAYLFHLEQLFKGENKDIKVYAIANCGFYDGRQNKIALQMIRNWCHKAGLSWGQGIGVGAGGMIIGAAVGKGPLKQAGIVLKQFADTILAKDTHDDILFDPNFSRKMYQLGAHFGWHQLARKNGLKKKDIKKKLI